MARTIRTTRTVRTLAALGLVAVAFQVRVSANPKGTKPSKVTVVKTSTTGHGGNQIKSGKTTTTSTKPTTKVDVKAAKATAKSTKVGAKTDAKLAKSTAKADAKSSKHATTTMEGSTTTGSTSGSSSGSTSDDSSSHSGTGSTTGGTSTSTGTVSSPLADKISRNPKLAAKVASRLPADMTLAQASTGFRNQGQFLAAVNVSRNLGIDFVKLQTAMTGQTVTVDPKTHQIITKPTGDAPVSLGRAIQTLKPGVDADGAVQTAQAQTSSMVQSTSTTAPATTTTTSTTTSSTTTASKHKKTHGH
jgi:hypothetical protein